MSLNEKLSYDLSNQSLLFDGSLTAELEKYTLVSALLKYSSTIDNNFTKDCNQKTVVIVDFKSEIREMSITKFQVFSDVFHVV